MTLYVTGAALAVLLLAACNTGVQENPVEIKTRASQSLSDMISTTPSDFTWEYFQEELVISGKAEAAANVELRALRIAEDDIAGTAVSSSVELSPDELDTGVPGNSWVPGDSWVPGNEWFPGSQWSPHSLYAVETALPPTSEAVMDGTIGGPIPVPENTLNAVVLYAAGSGVDAARPLALVMEEQQPEEIGTEPSAAMTDKVGGDPELFTWDFFEEEIRVRGSTDAAALDVKLRAVQITDGTANAAAESVSVEVSQEELDTGVPGNSWVPGDSWVPGNSWFPGSQWNPQDLFTSAAIAPLNSDAAVLEAVLPQLTESYNPEVNAVIVYADGAEIDGGSVFAVVLQKTS
jgi:hypothetical protein